MGDPAVIGNGNDPIGVSSTRALRDPESNCILKMSRGDVTWNSQGYGFFFYFFWVGGPQAHKHRLYAKAAILARRESRAGVGGGWARRAQAQPTRV